MESKILAIVGGGPRGLAALESVYCCLVTDNSPKVLNTILFEPKKLPGTSHVYDIEQPDTNWLNYSQRALTLAGRDAVECEELKIPSFPSFHQWSGYTQKGTSVVDRYPLRSSLGKYLHERYESIAAVLLDHGLLEVKMAKVIKTDWVDHNFEIVIEDGTVYHSNELLLTIGHQPTTLSDQLKDWAKYTDSNAAVHLFTEPYPVEKILKSGQVKSDKLVALRGFGLAMIDVMRALTIGLGGKFEVIDETTKQMVYHKSGKEPQKIIPFSLDGLPMAPKPLNEKIDAWFLPTDAEIKNFNIIITDASKKGNATNIHFLIEEIAAIIARVYGSLKGKAETVDLPNDELQSVVCRWLLDADYEHRLLVSKSNPPRDTLQDFIGMATGTKSISLDYCIGQVWRHCQTVLYSAMSFSNLKENIVEDVISLDERIKRYSYGPPVKSLQQMLALIESGLVNLDFVIDPKIETTREGWRLSSNNQNIIVNIMVNSVLDPAKLLETNSPIVMSLLKESLVEPVHGKLGIRTKKNACVELDSDRDGIPLAVLGRLSKGTIVGADAVLQCFDGRADLWAEGLVNRL